MRSAPAFSFGKARRAPEPKEDDFSYVTGQAREQVEDAKNAGTAALDLGRFPKAPAYSMGRRLDDNIDATEGPGPGNIPEMRRSEKGVRFGKSARIDEFDPTEGLPGPADYHYVSRRREGPTVTFSTAKTEEWSRGRDGPGPGKYHGDQVERNPRGPAATLVSRPPAQPEVGAAGPGPGKYLGDIVEKPHAVAFTKGKRMQQDTDTAGPGPGKYASADVLKPRGAAATMTSKPKDKPLGADGPGPGHYAPPDARSTKGGVMGGTYKKANTVDSGPGPMAYDDTATKVSAPAATMTFRKPNREDSAEVAIKRGGASLIGITHDQYSSDKGPAITMGTRHDYATKKHLEHAEHMPGPGSYASTYHTHKRPSAATLVSRPKSPWRDRNQPGPSDAPVVWPQKSTTAAIMTGRYKSKEAKHDVGPGPGAYTVDMTATGHRAKSTKGATMQFRPLAGPANDPHPDPGPGDYNPPVPRKSTQTLVMKPPGKLLAHATLRRSQGIVNTKQLNAKSEQDRRRQAAARQEQEGNRRKSSRQKIPQTTTEAHS
jgi:hypothetical protein